MKPFRIVVVAIQVKRLNASRSGAQPESQHARHRRWSTHIDDSICDHIYNAGISRNSATRAMPR